MLTSPAFSVKVSPRPPMDASGGNNHEGPAEPVAPAPATDTVSLSSAGVKLQSGDVDRDGDSR